MAKNKEYHCIKIKHRGTERIIKSISKMNVDEEIEFWNKKTEELLKNKFAFLNSISKKSSRLSLMKYI